MRKRVVELTAVSPLPDHHARGGENRRFRDGKAMAPANPETLRLRITSQARDNTPHPVHGCGDAVTFIEDRRPSYQDVRPGVDSEAWLKDASSWM